MAATGYVWTEFNSPHIVGIWVKYPQNSYVKAESTALLERET